MNGENFRNSGMKKITTFVFLIAFLASCKTIYINAWKDQMITCEPYTITKIEFGIDSLYLGISNDTVSVMRITIVQSKANYTIDGPDYCLLSVVNENNDTIARDAIGGMPSPGRPRTYTAYGTEVWKTKPDLSKIHISLPPYCDDLRLKKK